MAKTNKSAGGIGESKMFNAPDAEPDPILACHINGVLISELGLEPHILAVLNRQLTDEGIEEKNARPEVRESSGITLGADPFTKSLEQKRDDVIERDMFSYDARDPFREVADKHAVPGMRPKFMSAQKIKDGGNRDYEVVKGENGDPVKVKGMVLGHIPEERAQARNRHFQKKGNQFLEAIGEKYKQEGGATAVSDQN
jgi:hypothetical protein